MRKLLLALSLIFSLSSLAQGIGGTAGIGGQAGIGGGVPVGPGGISAANLAVWYRSDNLTCTGGCTGTNIVTTLLDKSTNGNNCTTSASPTYVASAVNSLPGILFTATSDQYCSFTGVAWGGNITVFAVLSCTTSGGSTATIVGGTTGNVFAYRACGGDAEQDAEVNTVGTIGHGTAAADTSYHQVGITYNGSAYAFYIAQTTDGSGTQARTVTGTNNALSNEGGGIYGNYTLAEVFIYTRILSSGEISTVQSYFHTRYGI